MPYIRCPYCNYRIFAPLAMDACPNCDHILPASSFLSLPASSAEDSTLPAEAPGRLKNMAFDDSTTPEDFINAPPVAHTVLGTEQANRRRLFRLSSLRGIVLSVQTQQEFQDRYAPDLVGGFFTALRDILWPMMDASRQREERIVSTQIRLRLGNGALRDARLEGRLVGANISLGDELTLWGRYRKGTLLVRRAYNHTTEARILTHHQSLASFLLLAISSLVLILALYLLISNLHQFLP